MLEEQLQSLNVGHMHMEVKDFLDAIAFWLVDVVHDLSGTYSFLLK